MTPADRIADLTREAEGAHAAGNYLLAGALMSQVNALLQAVQADRDGNPVAANAIRSYANEMEQA